MFRAESWLESFNVPHGTFSRSWLGKYNVPCIANAVRAALSVTETFPTLVG